MIGQVITVKKVTQKDRVQEHLEAFGSITTLQAFEEYAIMRLAAIIHKLRHSKGMVINTETIEGKNSFGERIYYGRYTFVREEDKQAKLF